MFAITLGLLTFSSLSSTLNIFRMVVFRSLSFAYLLACTVWSIFLFMLIFFSVGRVSFFTLYLAILHAVDHFHDALHIGPCFDLVTVDSCRAFWVVFRFVYMDVIICYHRSAGLEVDCVPHSHWHQYSWWVFPTPLEIVLVYFSDLLDVQPFLFLCWIVKFVLITIFFRNLLGLHNI